MCKLKKSQIEYQLVVNHKIVKSFANKKALEMYAEIVDIKNYSIMEMIDNERLTKRIC